MRLRRHAASSVTVRPACGANSSTWRPKSQPPVPGNVARGSGDARDFCWPPATPCRPTAADLVRHLPVGLRQFSGGAANALAGAGEGVDHVVDAAAEIAGEEMPAGMMQPRFGSRGGSGRPPTVSASIKARSGFFPAASPKLWIAPSPKKTRQAGVAIAAGDLTDRAQITCWPAGSSAKCSRPATAPTNPDRQRCQQRLTKAVKRT